MYSLTIEMTVGNNKVRFQTFHHQNFQIKISVELHESQILQSQVSAIS